MGRTSRTYPTYISGEAEEMDALEARFCRVWTEMQYTTRGEAQREIFKLGLETAEEKLSDDNSSIRRMMAVRSKINVIAMNETFFKEIQYMHNHLGDAEFEEWAAENDVQLSDYKEWKERNDDKGTKTDRCLGFLSTAIGDSHMKVADVRKAAVANGIIDEDDDKGWAFICRVASRYNYSGGTYGVWRRPNF